MARLLRFAPILVGLAFHSPSWATGTIAPCDANSQDFCGLQRPEAISFIPGTDWMVVTQLSSNAPVVFIESKTRQRVTLAPPFTRPQKEPSHQYGDVSAPNCPGPPAHFRAGSNDVKRFGTEMRMVFINSQSVGEAPAGEGTRIELFSVELRDGVPVAHWLGCFPVPAQYSLNDVAISPDGVIYASHQYDRTHSPAEQAVVRQKWLNREPTGFAIEWKHGTGWVRVPGTDVSFGNGVAVSVDGRMLAIAGTYSYEVVLVDRKTGAVQRVAVPLTPDNVNYLADGDFIVVGHTGVPVTGIDPCRDPKAVPCGFPFAVALVNQQGHVRVIYAHNGTGIPGASAAVLHGGRLYFGSAFGDRVAVVDAPAGAPLE